MISSETERDGESLAPIAKLVVEVVDGRDRGREVEAAGQEALTVGGAEGNSLRLGDSKVSRYHLELTRDRGAVHVQDLGSLNGTWAGNIRIQDALVTPGTRLRVGDTMLEIRDGSLGPGNDLRDIPSIPGFVASSSRGRRVAQQIGQLASSTASVLIRGETGTGKEIAARALHRLGPRREKPFVVVDCGSMAATLVASELFGHERGAFTGADKQRAGAFERAHGGTVFLDEIGELPPGLQPALLGVLERRSFRRVGGDAEIPVDVRVLAATHRDLRKSVNDGTFRADLYYRLAVAKLRLPALRERPEDIPPLVKHFARELTGEDGQELFRPDVLASLKRHHWAGNIRELRNVVESALALGRVQLDGELSSAEHVLPPLDQDPASDGPLPRYADARAAALDAFENSYLTSLVARCGSNASEAARVAKMDRNYLVSLLRKHALR